MSVTGLALILFLTFHASMNVVALFSAEGYNMICEFLGANWYAVVATVGLAGLMALHFIFAIWLTLQNKKARGGDNYDVSTKTNTNGFLDMGERWASSNMLVLGCIICVGLLLHLYNFWYNMMWSELMGNAFTQLPSPSDGYAWIEQTFSQPVFAVLYVIWLCAIWCHINHGFWSAIQTLGWSGKIWHDRWQCIGLIWSTIVMLMFAVVVIKFAIWG